MKGYFSEAVFIRANSDALQLTIKVVILQQFSVHLRHSVYCVVAETAVNYLFYLFILLIEYGYNDITVK